MYSIRSGQDLCTCQARGSLVYSPRGLYYLVNTLIFIVDKADVRTREKF